MILDFVIIAINLQLPFLKMAALIVMFVGVLND